jgi:hypothetical protein
MNSVEFRGCAVRIVAEAKLNHNGTCLWPPHDRGGQAVRGRPYKISALCSREFFEPTIHPFRYSLTRSYRKTSWPSPQSRIQIIQWEPTPSSPSAVPCWKSI